MLLMFADPAKRCKTSNIVFIANFGAGATSIVHARALTNHIGGTTDDRATPLSACSISVRAPVRRDSGLAQLVASSPGVAM